MKTRDTAGTAAAVVTLMLASLVWIGSANACPCEELQLPKKSLCMCGGQTPGCGCDFDRTRSTEPSRTNNHRPLTKNRPTTRPQDITHRQNCQQPRAPRQSRFCDSGC